MQPPAVRLARIAEEERRLAEEDRRVAEELRNAEQLKEELKTNPALRRKMQPKLHQELEIERDLAFQRMEDDELKSINGLPSLIQQITGHKLFWKWREQALLELRHLRQTERLDADDGWIFTMLDNSADTATILPITTPAAFALQQQQHAPKRLPWFRFGAGGMASSSVAWQPPGKRFSFRAMSQIGCKPEHYRWLKEGVETRFTKDQSCRDETTRRFWPYLARLFWTDGSGCEPHGQR